MDVVIQAMSGLMSMTGFPDKGPTGAGCAIADSTAGTYGAIGILGEGIYPLCILGEGIYPLCIDDPHGNENDQPVHVR
jgi:hypothetical protein